jgi:hypothetical protein
MIMDAKDNKQFRKDIKKISDVMVYAGTTKNFLRTTKRQALELAKKEKIHYYITDQIFLVKRKVIVIV